MFNDHTEFPADDVSNLVLANSETFHIIHATHTYCSEDVKLLPVTRYVGETYVLVVLKRDDLNSKPNLD